MLAILFPHMYEDIEYLIPAEELHQQQDSANGQSEDSTSQQSARKVAQVNAVAGPSRLR